MKFRFMLIKAFRPDRILSATKKFVFTLLGEDILRESEKVLDFKTIIETEVKKFFLIKITFYLYQCIRSHIYFHHGS
jgi:hypothetical protein